MIKDKKIWKKMLWWAIGICFMWWSWSTDTPELFYEGARTLLGVASIIWVFVLGALLFMKEDK